MKRNKIHDYGVDEDGLLEDVERIGMILRILEDTPPGVTTMLDLRQTLENQKADIEEKLERISQFVSCASALYSAQSLITLFAPYVPPDIPQVTALPESDSAPYNLRSYVLIKARR